MGSLLQKDRGGSNEEDGLSTFSTLDAWAPEVAEDTRAPLARKMIRMRSFSLVCQRIQLFSASDSLAQQK